MNTNERIQSVDFLRGLTIMFMILVNTPGDWSYVYSPFLHATWDGLTIADFVFPFFLFIVGISISFVYRSKLQDSGIYKKIFIRSIKLIVLGIFLNTFLPYYPFFNEIESIRIPGVLQRIGVVFCAVAILYLNFKRNYLILLAILILLGYWLWLAYMPFFDGTLPTLQRSSNNWANYIDVLVLKGHIWKPDYDPEGIISTLPAIVTTIIGTFVGEILMRDKKERNALLWIFGLSLLCGGYIWSLFFPINKALWSSSFVLVTSGYATLLLAIIHYFMDYKRVNFGNVVKYVGANAIIIYFLSSIIAKSFYLIKLDNQTTIHQWLFETFFVYENSSLFFSSFMYALIVVAFYVVLAYYLYIKKIVVKV